MDWNVEDEDRQALARIAGLLVSLAVLAEYACGRCHLLRCLILWILRPAEDCARNFAGGEASSTERGIDLPALGSAGGTVVELMRLAASFRALALAVRRLARRMRSPGRRPTPPCAGFRHLPQIVSCAPARSMLAALLPLDTS